MCGIAGFALRNGVAEGSHEAAVRRMTDRMKLRGPDAAGQWTGPGVVLGHRRLAILDLDMRAKQPMSTPDDAYHIVFNGEIYNFRSLREELEAQGVAFRTTSDTEVLLHLFAREGERMLSRLRGMFALAIWNAHSRELFLARDPYGIKPLYYTQLRDGVLFASQVKALLASGLVSKECEPAGLVGFYLWGSVPEPWTLFRNVYALPAGEWLRIRDGVLGAPVCWHDIREHWQGQGGQSSAHELEERVLQAEKDSVAAHLVADVPVSVFLSGGIDSSAIAALSSELGAQVEGITIGFEEFAGLHEDEVPMAAAIAAKYGLPHHVRRVSRAEFEGDIPRILDAMDQPSIDGVNTWFASKAAAERGYRVVLSGVGGDELFCGYSSFRRIPRLAALGRAVTAIPGSRALMSPIFNYFARKRSMPKLAGVPAFMDSVNAAYFLNRCIFLPGDLPALMEPDLAQEGLSRLGGWPPGMNPTEARDSLAQVGMLESTHYLRNQLLRDSDWASMGHSLELRTPLVDADLLRTLGPFVSGFGEGKGKAMLARTLERSLADSITKRPKSGFGVPIARWLSEMSNIPLAAPEVPWARQWARTVIQGMTD